MNRYIPGHDMETILARDGVELRFEVRGSGAPLARLEARVALGELLRRFDVFEIVGWKPREAFHVHGPSRLELCVR